MNCAWAAHCFKLLPVGLGQGQNRALGLVMPMSIQIGVGGGAQAGYQSRTPRRSSTSRRKSEMKEISTRRRVCGECHRYFVRDLADAGAILAPMLQNAVWKRLGYGKKDVICWDCVRNRAQQRLGRSLRDRDWQTCIATLRLGAYWHFPRNEVPPHLRPWFEAASLYFRRAAAGIMAKNTQAELLSMFYAVVETEGREPAFSRTVYGFREALGLERSPR